MNCLVQQSRNISSAAKNLARFRQISHVIFDMDGLLLDTEKLYTEVTQKILDAYNKTYTWETKIKCMGLQHQEMCETIVFLYDLPITWQEYSHLMRKYAIEIMENTDLMPGASRLLHHLHLNNIPFCLATSSGQEMVDIKCKNHIELFKLFDHKVCGSTDPDVKNGKPSPDIFLVAAQRFPDKPIPENCLVFEDAPNGVTAACAANMQVVMVPDQHVPKEMCSHATVVLESLEKFKPEEFGLPPFE